MTPAPQPAADRAAALFTPPTIPAPEKPLGVVRALMQMADNPIKVWDKALFNLPYRTGRFQGHTFAQMMDPPLVERVFLDEVDAFPKSPMQLGVLRPGIGEGMLTVEGEVWRRQRRAAAPAFRADMIAALAPIMAKAGTRAAERMSAAPGVIDVMPLMTEATLEIIAHAVLAPDNPGMDLPTVAAAVTDYVDTMGRIDAGDVFGVPAWVRIDKRRAFRAISRMQAAASGAIAWRRANGGDGRDLLNLLLSARDPETGEPFTETELRDNVLTFIAAGHETTALALTWTLYCIAGAPDIQDRLHTELMAVCPDRPATAADVDKLSVHEAAIKETMRLFPPVGVLQRRAVREVDLGPFTVESGGVVGALIYAMHRSTLLWDNPAAFDPDRFLDARAHGRHRCAWMPFGAGPRICIGLRFAMQEAVILLAELVRRVRFDPNPDYIPLPVLHLTMRPHAGMPLRVSPR